MTIRNPATERADKILALLDNPTQRSGERGYGRQQYPSGDPRAQVDAGRRYGPREWDLAHAIQRQVHRERSLLSLQALCGDEAEYAEAMERVDEIVAAGSTEPTALGAATSAKQAGADDPWIAQQIAVRGPRSGWSMLNWALFLVHISDWPNRDDVAALPEATAASPREVARALALVERHAPATAADFMGLAAPPVTWSDPVRSRPLDDHQQWLDAYEYDAERHP